MIQISLFGAGRIGQVHCEAVASIPGARIKNIYDLSAEAAERVSQKFGAKSVSEKEALNDPEVDAFIIASPSDTHCRLIMKGIRRNKPIFCEKPIGSDIDEVTKCANAIKECNGFCAMGFNRRCDPSFYELKKRLDRGDIGNFETLHLTSRDPGLPPFEYLKTSGGIFRDMMIHDFDVFRWLSGEEATEIYATGSCLVDKKLEEINDYDTAVVTIKTDAGKVCTILNNRRFVHGYDQRVEVLGSRGMLQVENIPSTSVVTFGASGALQDVPDFFFMQRYKDAYRIEIIDFIRCIQEQDKPIASEIDGINALILANAAEKSVRIGVPVLICPVRT